MFSFLYSEQKKMRRNAANWLDVADRVHKFRRDQLTETQNQKLLNAAGDLRRRLRDKADAGKLKLAIESLEGVLRETGGRIYPMSSLTENVEFFLVAAIVILGLRAYFVQPFKIPTNSMLPSYYGMTAETFTAENEPGLIGRLARLATFGANHHSVKAPTDGEVLLPVFRDYRPAVSEKSGRSMLIFPANYHEFTLSVGGEMVRVTVPAEFDYEFYDVLRNSFFPGRKESLNELLAEAAKQAAQPLESSLLTLQDGTQRGEARVYWIPVGKRVKQGETVLSFDVLSGDLLFVDRLSYNFVPPKVGSGFVFRTGGIEALKARAGDQYYVKRLVGKPGDVLEIKAPALYRNEKPIEGSAAFGRNARREGKYPGYTNGGLLPADGQLTVPEHVFFALGDNSPRSYDSRYWGFVPEKDVVGRPLFIYYPLTRRWGPAL